MTDANRTADGSHAEGPYGYIPNPVNLPEFSRRGGGVTVNGWADVPPASFPDAVFSWLQQVPVIQLYDQGVVNRLKPLNTIQCLFFDDEEVIGVLCK